MWHAKISFWRRKRVWVIGATSGIGYGLAKELVRAGATVIASGRSEKAMAALQNDGMIPFKLDVTEEKWPEFPQGIGGPVDVLIYSAGSWTAVDIPSWDQNAFNDQVKVNFLGLAKATSIVLPEMMRRNKGTIVGISSASGYTALPRAEAYGSSKAAVMYFLQSLRIDLMGTNIRVVEVNPGFIDTPLTEKNDFYMPFLGTVDDSTKAILGGIEGGSNEIHFPRKLTVPIKILRLLPAPIIRYLIMKITKRRSHG
tara:strand:+ start:1905 stop:2669 length:765 start_codon:yes stop_codon:yes gene_type:complete